MSALDTFGLTREVPTRTHAEATAEREALTDFWRWTWRIAAGVVLGNTIMGAAAGLVFLGLR